MADNRPRTCGTASKYKWKHKGERQSELIIPTRCGECTDEQREFCLGQSWKREGKDPKMLPLTNILVNINADADKKAEKVAAKAQQSLEQIKDKVQEEQLEIAEAKADAKE